MAVKHPLDTSVKGRCSKRKYQLLSYSTPLRLWEAIIKIRVDLKAPRGFKESHSGLGILRQEKTLADFGWYLKNFALFFCSSFFTLHFFLSNSKHSLSHAYLPIRIWNVCRYCLKLMGDWWHPYAPVPLVGYVKGLQVSATAFSADCTPRIVFPVVSLGFLERCKIFHRRIILYITRPRQYNHSVEESKNSTYYFCKLRFTHTKIIILSNHQQSQWCLSRWLFL